MWTIALSLLLAAAEPSPAATRGRQVFSDPAVGRTGASCAMCHAAVKDELKEGDGLIRAGHSLWGVAKRPYWRGDERKTSVRNLNDALKACAQLFLGVDELGPTERQGLVAYLESISPTRDPPIQIKSALEANLDYRREKYIGGDSTKGRALFSRACHSCHPLGAAGLGPTLIGKKPEDVARRTREGNGLLRGVRIEGQWSPFFGKDRLTDTEVANIGAYVASLVEGE